MDRAVVGMLLVQFQRKTSIIHAFGHGFSRRYTLQQGTIHAVLAPHVLEYLFEDRSPPGLLAEAFDVDRDAMSGEAVAEAVVAAVTEVRNSFDLPTKLREIDPVESEDFPEIAEFILADSSMDQAPRDLQPTADEIESVLHAAW